MNKETAFARLKASEPAIRALGIERLSIFGSTARNEAKSDSDLDLAIALDPAASIGMFRYAEINRLIEQMLQSKVDIVTEPNRNLRLQAEIDRDRVRIF